MRKIIVGSPNKKLKSNKINRNEYSLLYQPFITIIRYFYNIENLYCAFFTRNSMT